MQASVNKAPDTLNWPHISLLSVSRERQGRDGTLNEQVKGSHGLLPLSVCILFVSNAGLVTTWNAHQSKPPVKFSSSIVTRETPVMRVPCGAQEVPARESSDFGLRNVSQPRDLPLEQMEHLPGVGFPPITISRFCSSMFLEPLHCQLGSSPALSTLVFYLVEVLKEHLLHILKRMDLFRNCMQKWCYLKNMGQKII